MALNVTISALYLGTLADLDTNESNNTMESGGSLIGTYGSVGAPLYKTRPNIVTNSPTGDPNPDQDDAIALDHADTGTPDTISYDIGAGPVTTQIDSAASVTGTITFVDGTTLTDSFAVFQDQTGALFLSIWDSQTTLDDKAVRSFEITSVNNTDYGGLLQTSRDDLQFIACFTDDALILTPRGTVPIDTLKAGDLVMTRDHGAQPIRWIGGTTLPQEVLKERKKLRPYRIKADCFGPGMPFRPLTVSPQHRILAGGQLIKNCLGEEETLIAAKHLDSIRGIRQLKPKRAVTYRHILFDRHEIIYANGLATESLLIGAEAHRRLPKALIEEIETILPDLAKGPAAHPPARALARGHQARLLTQRLQRRRKHGRSYDGPTIAPCA